MTTPTRPVHVFDYLDQIRARPAMYVRSADVLHEVETLLSGYHTALSMHGVVESVPSMTRPFTSWIRHRHPTWSLCSGWASWLNQRAPSRGFDRLDDLFALVDEYRQLVPTVVFDVTLQPHHQPTGRRVRIGTNTRMERPDRVQVVQYRPAPLHVLRFFYEGRVEERTLEGENAAVETDLGDAERWLADELGLGATDDDA